MILAASAAKVHVPHIDWSSFSPVIALLIGAILVLLVGLLRSRFAREQLVPATTLAVLGAALGLTIWRWHDPASIISGALRVDDLALFLTMIFLGAAMSTV